MTTKLRAFLVAVDYDDLLAVTLPYNRHHFQEVWVVTTPFAHGTARICKENQAKFYGTNAFYDDGADFNKWKALEECITFAGRYSWPGWNVIMDADVLWPRRLPWLHYSLPDFQLEPGNLYTPLRRMAPWPITPETSRGTVLDSRAASDMDLIEETTWSGFPLHPQQREWAGYSQIFHSTDPCLPADGPWHQTDWKHAGGADSFFQARWPAHRKLRPPFEVLHLGESGQNWCGRATTLADGTVPQEGRERREQVQRYIRGRTSSLRETGDRFRRERLD